MIKRSDALQTLSRDHFDVVVIGGGITGAGVALDAAARGYSVALIEQRDFAAGTSSRSSKLVHGGLRYLQHFDLGLVREALLERQLMVKLAPHLVKPLKLVVPAFRGERLDLAVGIGLNLYDVMSIERGRGRRGRAGQSVPTPDWSPDRHRTITGAEVAELLPALAAKNPTSGYLFYDCQTDDVRLVLTVLDEAVRFGAICANRVRALELIERDHVAVGVRVQDTLSDQQFDIQADNVINATGVWADQLCPEELHDEAEVPVIRPSRGTHITLAHEQLPIHAGAILPAGNKRTIFALPWLGHTLIGTTDNDYEGELEHIQPAQEDIEYLLSAVNKFFGTTLGSQDLTGAYAGVRPLISSGDPKKSVDISRREELYETSSGMLTITGGKLTTWRRMAKLTVDRLVERDGRSAPCRTAQIPLGMEIAPASLTAAVELPAATNAHLASRYGHTAHQVLNLVAGKPELAQPIVPGEPDIMAEVAFAARYEQAHSVGDVLLRRTRLGLLAAHALCGKDSAIPARVAEVLASELGWGQAQTAQAGQDFAVEAAAEGIAAG